VLVKRHKTSFVPSENQLNFTLEATECLDPDKINLCDATIKLKDLKTMQYLHEFEKCKHAI
jgi:hypothetical protein